LDLGLASTVAGTADGHVAGGAANTVGSAAAGVGDPSYSWSSILATSSDVMVGLQGTGDLALDFGYLQ
jgi:hypothetical protein